MRSLRLAALFVSLHTQGRPGYFPMRALRGNQLPASSSEQAAARSLSCVWGSTLGQCGVVALFRPSQGDAVTFVDAGKERR